MERALNLSELWSGQEKVLFAKFAGLPFPSVLAAVATILLVTFFVTSADSATLVLVSMASDEAVPSTRAKLLWGVLQPCIAVALLLSGGLAGLRAAAVVTALPFCFVLTAIAWSVLRRLSSEEAARMADERERNRRVDALLDHVEATASESVSRRRQSESRAGESALFDGTDG